MKECPSAAHNMVINNNLLDPQVKSFERRMP